MVTKEKCNSCGFEERRVTDHKVPLVLDFIDGNRKITNMKILGCCVSTVLFL